MLVACVLSDGVVVGRLARTGVVTAPLFSSGQSGLVGTGSHVSDGRSRDNFHSSLHQNYQDHPRTICDNLYSVLLTGHLGYFLERNN